MGVNKKGLPYARRPLFSSYQKVMFTPKIGIASMLAVETVLSSGNLKEFICPLNGLWTTFAGTNPNDVVHGADEDFAIPDFARFGG